MIYKYNKNLGGVRVKSILVRFFVHCDMRRNSSGYFVFNYSSKEDFIKWLIEKYPNKKIHLSSVNENILIIFGIFTDLYIEIQEVEQDRYEEFDNIISSFE